MLDYLLGNAVSGNRLERIRWLLAHGADVRSVNFYTGRRLHTEALLQGYMEDCAAAVAEFLLAQGVDPLLKNEDGATAAEFAEKWGLDAAADLLRSPRLATPSS